MSLSMTVSGEIRRMSCSTHDSREGAGALSDNASDVTQGTLLNFLIHALLSSKGNDQRQANSAPYLNDTPTDLHLFSSKVGDQC